MKRDPPKDFPKGGLDTPDIEEKLPDGHGSPSVKARDVNGDSLADLDFMGPLPNGLDAAACNSFALSA